MPGDVVPFAADQLRPGRKIGLVLVDEVVEATECYLAEDCDEGAFVVFGAILRRVYFEGRDQLVIDDGDVWTDSRCYAVDSGDLLPSMPIEYRDDVWGIDP